MPGVAVVFSPLDLGAQSQVSADGHATFAFIGVNGNEDERLALAPQLEAVARKMTGEQLEVYVTGYSPVTAELAEQAGTYCRSN